MSVMPVEAISDQKRLVRGEHWLRARYFLRVRDHAHHRAWRVLMIAGPAPHEEIACIRELMPHAHITAVDIVEANILAAIEAGADDALLCDLGAYQTKRRSNGYGDIIEYLMPPQLAEKVFDVICLDLTSPANDWLKRVASVYFKTALAPQGVMMLTFSYGRDVVEAIAEEWRREVKAIGRYNAPNHSPLQSLTKIPEQLAARVFFIFRSLVRQLDSCLQYRGNRMPMVSCLLWKKGTKNPPASFRAVASFDYDNVVSQENLGNIYACPADRLAELQKTRQTRKRAARKAIETRQQRKQTLAIPMAPLLQLVARTSEGDDGRE